MAFFLLKLPVKSVKSSVTNIFGITAREPHYLIDKIYLTKFKLLKLNLFYRFVILSEPFKKPSPVVPEQFSKKIPSKTIRFIRFPSFIT